MYATYNTLYHNPCGQTKMTAHTDRSRFTCGSLPVQSQVRKSINDPQYFPLDADCAHDCPDPGADCQYACAKKKKTTPILIKPSKKTPTPTPRTIPSREGFTLETPPQRSSIAGQDQTKLLPVMDPEFNLREICKQCILLEDHLCHNEKRCFDCCVKHFLTIEALAEEALTLGGKASDLPSRVRRLQQKWHQDPDKNALAVSQELRKIRKDFQIDAFDVVFRSSAASCEDGVCRLSPQQTG